MYRRCCLLALYCIVPQSSAPEYGRKYHLKHVELIVIINKLLLLHLVCCLFHCISDVGHINIKCCKGKLRYLYRKYENSTTQSQVQINKLNCPKYWEEGAVNSHVQCKIMDKNKPSSSSSSYKTLLPIWGSGLLNFFLPLLPILCYILPSLPILWYILPSLSILCYILPIAHVHILYIFQNVILPS